MGWWGKKQLNSEEYEKLVRRVLMLETQLTQQEMLLKSLRGIVSRKLYGGATQEQNQTIKYNDGFDHLRTNGEPKPNPLESPHGL